MRIAVIGGGISGLAAAWLLKQAHEVSLFEAADYLGGHTNTVDVDLEGQRHPVDTGFLVHNDLTYPQLIALFRHLGVETYPSRMSFSVQVPGDNLEWAGSSLSSLFAQRRNLLRPAFWRLLKDTLSFNAQAEVLLQESLDKGWTLGELLRVRGYGQSFRDWYLLPMAAAIWSAAPRDIEDFPAATFLRFCLNHRLLQIKGRPTWLSIRGGGRSYVEKMSQGLDVRLSTPVDAVERIAEGVAVRSRGQSETFDALVLATHAPDSLRMLRDANDAERTILGAVRYQPNLAILHCDPSFLPQRQSLWSAWNYLASGDAEQPVCVTYLLNQLQQLPFSTPLMVTLNPPEGRMPNRQLARFHYDHPLFDQPAIQAQQQLDSIQGKRQIWFCGAWCGYGFHEDGLRSALRVAADFQLEAPWQRNC